MTCSPTSEIHSARTQEKDRQEAYDAKFYCKALTAISIKRKYIRALGR